MSEASVNVLIVDDRPEKLLALETILEDLAENLVRAESGREALRQVLHREFAVILLDVNMPGMDGFETAQLIRQRKNCSDVPIIFLTAMGDDMHKMRGYSLGAVDFILTPVVPQVLRSKVAVFVDLFRKNRQVRLQAERLRQRNGQLHQLTAASSAIHSAASLEKIFQITADIAREIIDTHQAMVLTDNQYPNAQDNYCALSTKYAGWAGPPPWAQSAALAALLKQSLKPIRASAQELETQVPALPAVDGRPRLRGVLSVPMVGRGGDCLGRIVLTDKADGEFTDDDQTIIIQLGQMASLAVENSLFAAEREDNRLKEEFLSNLSHELRTPLSAMSGWIQLLRRLPVSEDLSHGLEVIERNVHAQTKLIEDLLDLSRINSGKLRLNCRPVRLAPLLQAAVDVMRPIILERQLSLNCDLDGAEPNVSGDPDRLQQVFWNLLSNAAKFTPAGGKISVHLRTSGGLCRVSIEDTGQGIDREFLPHVFHRFRQAEGGINRRHGGLGIGLTIARHLVELHGGAITAESAGAGRGATFTITLSEIAEQAVSGEKPPADEEAPSLEGVRILLVDDHPDAREVVCTILRRQQADVAAAASAREAISSIAADPPDILVTDIGMPQEDGFALLRQLRRLPVDQGGTMPAIALTAYASATDRVKALEAGFAAHLAKPVNPQELIRAVHRHARAARPA